jgi:hypothetical protein
MNTHGVLLYAGAPWRLGMRGWHTCFELVMHGWWLYMHSGYHSRNDYHRLGKGNGTG